MDKKNYEMYMMDAKPNWCILIIIYIIMCNSDKVDNNKRLVNSFRQIKMNDETQNSEWSH